MQVIIIAIWLLTNFGFRENLALGVAQMGFPTNSLGKNEGK